MTSGQSQNTGVSPGAQQEESNKRLINRGRDLSIIFVCFLFVTLGLTLGIYLYLRSMPKPEEHNGDRIKEALVAMSIGSPTIVQLEPKIDPSLRGVGSMLKLRTIVQNQLLNRPSVPLWVRITGAIIIFAATVFLLACYTVFILPPAGGLNMTTQYRNIGIIGVTFSS